MTKKTLSFPVHFQDSWLSYCGAVAGVLQALGISCDTADVGGYSGYAFLTNVTEGWTDPGSPTLHSGNVEVTIPAVLDLWAEIVRGTESLGLKLEHFWDPRQYRAWLNPLPHDLRERAAALFERVKAALDANRPVVLWGLPVPEYGIVVGYEDDQYLVSSFRTLIGQPETPVHFAEVQAKGGLEALFFGERMPVSEEADRLAIARAVWMAEGTGQALEFDTPRHPIRERQRYVTGPAAYDEWARVLEESRPDTVYYEYNSYVAACLHESKRLAARFLRRLAEKHAGRPQAAGLARAAEAYEQVEAQMAHFAALFPYADSGEMPLEKCREGASILRTARPHELAALDHLRAAHATWG